MENSDLLWRPLKRDKPKGREEEDSDDWFRSVGAPS